MIASSTSLPSPPPTYSLKTVPVRLSQQHQQRDDTDHLDLEARSFSLANPENINNNNNNSNCSLYLPPIHNVMMMSPPSNLNSPIPYHLGDDASSISSFPSSPPSSSAPTVYTPLISDSCKSTPYSMSPSSSPSCSFQPPPGALSSPAPSSPMTSYSSQTSPSPSLPSLSLTSSSSPSTQRKGSIASLLNSDPELKLLDEEEIKCGYQSHFMNAGVKRPLSQPSFSSSPTDQKRKKQCSKQRRSPYASTSMSTPSTPSGSPFPITRASLVFNERATKGLRHFSKQVCDKVKDHGVTTYDQVVHELTCDLAKSNSFCQLDQKNIRRRVYDALNVLTAMNIIAKDKKEIKWLGISSCYQFYANQNNDLPRNTDNDAAENKMDDDNHSIDGNILVEQIRAEEARKEKLVANTLKTRAVIRNTLIMYLQLRRLIRRNQHESGHEPLTALPFMVFNSNENAPSLVSDVASYQQQLPTSASKSSAVSLTLSSLSPPSSPFSSPTMSSAAVASSLNYPTLKDVDILHHHFRHEFTSQELSSWLPDSTWQRYLDVAS